MLDDPHRRNVKRLFWTLALGLMLGGLLTQLSVSFLPESAAKNLLTISVEGKKDGNESRRKASGNQDTGKH